MLPSYQARKGFWSEAIALQGSVTTKVLPSVILCGVTSLLMSMLTAKAEEFFVDAIALDISPSGFAGAVRLD